jgi:hypothetical protein
MVSMGLRSWFALAVAVGFLLTAMALAGTVYASPNNNSNHKIVLTATCPNSDYQGASTKLSFTQVVACAKSVGFTSVREIAFIAMAYQESTFVPGVTEYGGCAAGILQEGAASGGCPGPFPISHYNPNSCSTYAANGWNGVWYNPTCAFKWAYAYYHYVGGFNFWGSYLSGAYCKWSPNGFKGAPNPDGTSVSCSGSGQNQAGFAWSSVGL